MNPVVVTLGFFGTLFGGGGAVALIMSLINRKADVKEQDAKTTETLERASASFRAEVRKENVALKAEMHDMKEAFIELTDVLDDLLPKMIPCLDLEEKMRLRAANNRARLLT